MSYSRYTNKTIKDLAFKKQKGLCYYCKAPMRLMLSEWSLFKMAIPDDAATLEHIYSMHDIRRYARVGKFSKNWTVCCCHKCNREKNSRECAPHAWPKAVKREVFDIRILIDPFFVSQAQLFGLIFDPFTGIM